MNKSALAAVVVLGGLFAVLGFQDPLAAASLTSGQRAAGLLSTDITVSGENCRFCRINIERTLEAVPGVKLARSDMAHHRARVVYDPKVVQPDDLTAVIRQNPLQP